MSFLMQKVMPERFLLLNALSSAWVMVLPLTFWKKMFCTDFWTRKMYEMTSYGPNITLFIPVSLFEKVPRKKIHCFHKQFYLLNSNKFLFLDSSSSSATFTFSLDKPSTQLFMKIQLKTLRFRRCFFWTRIDLIFFFGHEFGYTSGLNGSSYCHPYCERCWAKLR